MITETLSNCTICASNNIDAYLECTDHFVSKENFHLSKCGDCGFVFTNPRPPLHNIAPYYESDEYVSHSKTSKGLVNRLFHLSRIYTLAYKKRIVNKYSTGNNLLDYGCGTGDFLEAMSGSWACTGIEPNPHARQEAASKTGLMVHEENELATFEESSFDAITLWHVLEHVYPLKERLQRFHQLLTSKGTLFVALPNMNAHDAKYYGRYWAAWDVPRHIHHFNPETIKRLLNDSGFTHVDTRPMLLDAFYISMLSEQYMHGSSKMINAIIQGLRSNISAIRSTKNYSSLIYIFKKSK